MLARPALHLPLQITPVTLQQGHFHRTQRAQAGHSLLNARLFSRDIERRQVAWTGNHTQDP